MTYTRWGRTSCSRGAELVYRGTAGGERYTHSGGGTNTQCLPENPIYNNYFTGIQSAAYMYNTEYQTEDWNPFSPRAFPNDDVPCAVCRVKRKSSLLHIPARNVCPSGWRKEYDGYLMTDKFDHAHPRDFLCVHKHAESVQEHGAIKMALYSISWMDGAAVLTSPMQNLLVPSVQHVIYKRKLRQLDLYAHFCSVHHLTTF